MKTADILSFHPGRQHNLEQAAQLQKGFPGFRHATSIYFGSDTVAKWQSLSAKIGSQLRRRSGALDAAIVDTHAVPELKLLWKRSKGRRIETEDYLERNLLFQKWILRTYKPPQVCIGYDTSSWHVFKHWKNKSLLVLDLSIAIPQYKRVLAEQNGFGQAFLKEQTKDDLPVYTIYEQELAYADVILCGSEFVKQSCLSVGVPQEKLVVLPYGADLSKFNGRERQESSEAVKIVFVGSVNQRKGADMLLQVWPSIANRFPKAELHFFGGVQLPVDNSLPNVFYHGFVSQDALIAEMKTAAISVLPTFFEGSSLAVYQSMAMGLAVLTTPNAGSIIEDGYNGLLVKYGDVQALAAQLSLLISNKELRDELGTQAFKTVNQYTWDAYGAKLNGLLKSHLGWQASKKIPVPT